MLGQHIAGGQAAVIDPAFGDNTLSFSEQAWQRAIKADSNLANAVGDHKL